MVLRESNCTYTNITILDKIIMLQYISVYIFSFWGGALQAQTGAHLFILITDTWLPNQISECNWPLPYLLCVFLHLVKQSSKTVWRTTT